MSSLRVSYQGVAGAFSEEAIALEWNGEATPVPARTFSDAIEFTLNGSADIALIPCWNSAIGSVAPAIEALGAHAHLLSVQGEVILPIRQHLLALPGTSVDNVRYVGSHPAALAQCTGLFRENPYMTAHHAFDTAGAAQELAMLGVRQGAGDRGSMPAGGKPGLDGEQDGIPAGLSGWYRDLPDVRHGSLAVIAGSRAAKIHGLVMLRNDVHDDVRNKTCFLIMRPSGHAASGSRANANREVHA